MIPAAIALCVLLMCACIAGAFVALAGLHILVAAMLGIFAAGFAALAYALTL